MHRAFTTTANFWRAANHKPERPTRALVVTDMGPSEGIDVVIQCEATCDVLFETVLSGPESRSLLTSGSPETEAFWHCLQSSDDIGLVPDLFLTVRCCFSFLTTAIPSTTVACPNVRNVALLRLIEDILDELQTRAPDISVEVAITHRNPLFANFVSYG